MNSIPKMEDSSVLQTPVKRCKNKAQFLFSGLVTSNHRMTSATSEACKSTKRSPRNEGASNSGAENTGTGEGHHTPMCQDRGGRGGDGGVSRVRGWLLPPRGPCCSAKVLGTPSRILTHSCFPHQDPSLHKLTVITWFPHSGGHSLSGKSPQ